MLLGLAVLVFVLVAACGGGGVDWEQYSPGLQGRIDGMASAGDCAGLQSAFNAADANDAANRARTGEGNAELMDYIDDAMRDAGCPTS